LLCATRLECRLAAENHAAVHDAADDRRCLTARHADHGLVQQSQSFRHVPGLHQHVALRVQGERQQVAVVAALGDGDRLGRDCRGPGEVARRLALEHVGQQEVAALHAVRAGFVDQPLAARQPAGSASNFATDHQRHAGPEGAPGGAQPVTRLQARQVRALHRSRVLLLPAQHVARRRELQEAIDVECILPRQILVCRLPHCHDAQATCAQRGGEHLIVPSAERQPAPRGEWIMCAG